MSNGFSKCNNCCIECSNEFKYCPNCGNKLRGLKPMKQHGMLVLNCMLFIIAVLMFFVSARFHTLKDDFYSDIFLSVSVALIPTSIISIINLTILYNENKESMIRDSERLMEHIEETVDNRLNLTQRFVMKCLNLDKVGLIAAYQNRDSAFQDIYEAISVEENEIIITATSLK